MRLFTALFATAAALAITACSGSDNASTETPPQTTQTSDETLTIYSSRHYDSDKLIYAAFTEATGIKVEARETKAAQLLETMKAEGAGSPADLVITADAGSLYRFQEAGLLQPLQDEAINAVIPAQFREPDGHWIGLAKRVRVIAYDPARLSPDQVDEYTDLADAALKDEVCQRPSSNIYNLSLMADLIDRHGSEKAAAIASGIVANFARDPKGGDTDQIKSIAAGECSAAFVNHYYFVRLAMSDSAADRKVAESVKLSFPDQEYGGTHVNITGAGIAANAPNKAAATAFLQFLITPEGQAMLVSETREFPMVEGVPLPDGLSDLPSFVSSTTPLIILGENQNEAQMIYDAAGWN